MPENGNDYRGCIAWMTRNPVTANLFMIILLVGGVMTTRRIKKEVFPDFTLDMVSIQAPYPGASPEEVERGIIQSVEENIRGLEGVKKITIRPFVQPKNPDLNSKGVNFSL